jgi:hypothetical protein
MQEDYGDCGDAPYIPNAAAGWQRQLDKWSTHTAKRSDRSLALVDMKAFVQDKMWEVSARCICIYTIVYAQQFVQCCNRVLQQQFVCVHVVRAYAVSSIVYTSYSASSLHAS